MPRRQKIEGGTKNKILEVGRRMFFENGFDGTGVRAIMREVGLDVGAFYYYFKTKDELFDAIMADFFAPYRPGFSADRRTEPDRLPIHPCCAFSTYLYEQVQEFRAHYEGKMHCTVRWAIREQMLTVIEPYLEELLNVMTEHGAHPCMEIRTMAVFLAHGVGSCLLHEDTQWVASTAEELCRTVDTSAGHRRRNFPENAGRNDRSASRRRSGAGKAAGSFSPSGKKCVCRAAARINGSSIHENPIGLRACDEWRDRI